MTDILWCCHVRGPDEVYPAPDYETALKWADGLNALNWSYDEARYPKPGGFANPASYDECLIKAVPAPWPHSPESHAEDLEKTIAGFAEPVVHGQFHHVTQDEKDMCLICNPSVS